MEERKLYTIIKEFDCHGKQIIPVKIGNAVHVMDFSDWQLIYRRNHQHKWNAKVDFNKYDYSKGHRKVKVS